MSGRGSGPLVFLALGSIGDALPIAIVAAEAASQLQVLQSETQISVTVLTHAQHLSRLDAHVVGLELVKCTALDLDIFPASELDKTSRARMCRHRDGSPVQSSASTQMPEPRNRSGKDYAAMTGAELDVIKVACQQIGLGSAGSGKERDRGALVMNLFAAHALMVAEYLDVPALVLCPSVAPPTANPPAIWNHFQRIFPELAAALPRNKRTATLALPSAAVTTARAPATALPATTTQRSLSPSAEEVVQCWLPLLLGKHYAPWRKQRGLPPLADALLARCRLLEASQQYPQELSPLPEPLLTSPKLPQASSLNVYDSSDMSSLLARAQAWKQNQAMPQSQPSNDYSSRCSNVNSIIASDNRDMNVTSSIGEKRLRQGVPPSSVPILYGIDALLMSSRDMAEGSKRDSEHSRLHPMVLYGEVEAVPNTWPSRPSLSSCLGAFHQDDAIIRSDRARLAADGDTHDSSSSEDAFDSRAQSDFNSKRRRRSSVLDTCESTDRLNLERFLDSARAGMALLVLVDMGSMAALAGELEDGDGKDDDSQCGRDNVDAKATSSSSDEVGLSHLVEMIYSEVGTAALTIGSYHQQQDSLASNPPLLQPPVRVLYLSHNAPAPLRATISNTMARLNSQSESNCSAMADSGVSSTANGVAAAQSSAMDKPTALHYTGTVAHAWLFWRLGCSSSSFHECENDSVNTNSTNGNNKSGVDSLSNSSGTDGSAGAKNSATAGAGASCSAPHVVWLHHGGAGSTACAARWGVPQIVVPLAMDQGFWAQRVKDHGVGAVIDLALLVDDISDSAGDEVAAAASGTTTPTTAATATTMEAAARVTFEKCRKNVREALQQSLSLACASKCTNAAKAFAARMEENNSMAKHRKTSRGQVTPWSPLGSSTGAVAAAEAALNAAGYE